MSGYVTLYLDESGEKTWPPNWGKSAHKFYIMAGPVLTPEQDRKAHQRIPEILSEFFPEDPLRPRELHYGDLINRRPPYDGLSDEDRRDMADSVWGLILSLRPTLIGSVVDKVTMCERYVHPDPTNEYAMRATIERFDRHLEETDNLGMAMMDTESLESDRALRAIVHDARRFGIKYGGIAYVPATDRKLERVLNSVSFTPSEMSPGIQLADYIAYATFSHFERAHSIRYNQIDPLWRRSGAFKEPSVIPKRR